MIPRPSERSAPMHSIRPLFPFVFAALLALMAGAEVTFAASRTGPIAVLDFDLGNTLIKTLDENDIEVKGTLKVFENHKTPLRSDGSLDLDRFRGGTPSFTGRIELKRRGSSSLGHPKKNYSLDLKDT